MENIKRSAVTYSNMRNAGNEDHFVLYIRFLKNVLKESPIYINFTVFRVIESYRKIKSYPEICLNLVIVTRKCGQICEKDINHTELCSLLTVIVQKLL